MLIRSGIILIKYWFSVSDEEQEKRFKGTHTRSDEAVETKPHGLGSAFALGGILKSQGHYVSAHRHKAVSLVGRRS